MKIKKQKIKSYKDIVSQSGAFREKKTENGIGSKSAARLTGKLTGKDYYIDKWYKSDKNCEEYLLREFSEKTKTDESELLEDTIESNDEGEEFVNVKEEPHLLKDAYESVVRSKNSLSNKDVIKITSQEVLEEFQYNYAEYCLDLGNHTFSKMDFENLKETASKHGVNPVTIMKFVEKIHNNEYIATDKAAPVDVLLYFLDNINSFEGKYITEKFDAYLKTFLMFNVKEQTQTLPQKHFKSIVKTISDPYERIHTWKEDNEIYETCGVGFDLKTYPHMHRECLKVIREEYGEIFADSELKASVLGSILGKLDEKNIKDPGVAVIARNTIAELLTDQDSSLYKKLPETWKNQFDALSKLADEKELVKAWLKIFVKDIFAGKFGNEAVKPIDVVSYYVEKVYQKEDMLSLTNRIGTFRKDLGKKENYKPIEAYVRDKANYQQLAKLLGFSLEGGNAVEHQKQLDELIKTAEENSVSLEQLLRFAQRFNESNLPKYNQEMTAYKFLTAFLENYASGELKEAKFLDENSSVEDGFNNFLFAPELGNQLHQAGLPENDVGKCIETFFSPTYKYPRQLVGLENLGNAFVEVIKTKISNKETIDVELILENLSPINIMQLLENGDYDEAVEQSAELRKLLALDKKSREEFDYETNKNDLIVQTISGVANYILNRGVGYYDIDYTKFAATTYEKAIVEALAIHTESEDLFNIYINTLSDFDKKTIENIINARNNRLGE